jgi:NADPH-dependent 7-cyano-7-deazaguanine reductase QueF
MRVDVDYNIRGGVHTTVFREWGKRGKAGGAAR